MTTTVNEARGQRRAAAVEETARVFDNREARDRFVEATYRYDRLGYTSTPAYVAGELEELVRQFYAWHEGVQDLAPALVQFEVETFGGALEPVPHGMLLFAIKQSQRDGIPKRPNPKVPPRKRGEGSLDYLERICHSNGWPAVAARDVLRSMPEAKEEQWRI